MQSQSMIEINLLPGKKKKKTGAGISMPDFSEIAGIEYLLIDNDTTISSFKKELRWNDLYYHLAKGI